MVKLYKKAKKQLNILFISLASLIFSVFILNDFIEVVDGFNQYMLIVVKWFMIMSILTYDYFIVLEILSILNPLNNEHHRNKKDVANSKKEHILNKDILLTKSDMIIKKYKSNLK